MFTLALADHMACSDWLALLLLTASRLLLGIALVV
jgi:hypothetical protein